MISPCSPLCNYAMIRGVQCILGVLQHLARSVRSRFATERIESMRWFLRMLVINRQMRWACGLFTAVSIAAVVLVTVPGPAGHAAARQAVKSHAQSMQDGGFYAHA